MAMPRAEVVLEGYARLVEVREKLGLSVDPVTLRQAPETLLAAANSISDTGSHPCSLALKNAADVVLAYRHLAAAVSPGDQALGNVRGRMQLALNDAHDAYLRLMAGWHENVQMARRLGGEPDWMDADAAGE